MCFHSLQYSLLLPSHPTQTNQMGVAHSWTLAVTVEIFQLSLNTEALHSNYFISGSDKVCLWVINLVVNLLSPLEVVWTMNEELDLYSKRVEVNSIEGFHVTLSSSRLWRKTESSRHVGVQRDRSFCSDFYEMNDILIMLLISVESDKISLLHKLKQLYKCLPLWVFLKQYHIYC